MRWCYRLLATASLLLADATHPSLGYSHATARVEFDYDANGARSAARTYNAANALLYSETTPHDERGRTDYKDTAVGRLDYSYYANNLLKDTVSSNNGGVNLGYRYDEVNRLESVDDTSTGLPTRTSGYTYNANGSLETVTLPNAVVHTYAYDALNRLRGLVVARGSTLLHTYEYKLNPSGHRRQVIENAAKTTTYTYDDLYRLSGESIAGDPQGNSGALGYGLDKVGNRLSRTSTVAAVASAANSFNARDWLSGDTYNANGSTTVGLGLPAAQRGTDVYDFEERLILRTKTDGSSLNLGYDADGNRIAKNILNLSSVPVSTTSWLVDDNNLTGYAQVVEERVTVGSTSTLRVFTYGSQLLSQATTVNGQAPVISYYTRDGHGSVRELTDPAGAITDRYDYDAFGVLIARSGPTANAFLYCGEQFDADLGLYYLRARYLNPDSGRFWSQDTYEGSGSDPMSLHKYLYANGDPVRFVDPSGRLSAAEMTTTQTQSLSLRVTIAVPRVPLTLANPVVGPTLGTAGTAILKIGAATIVASQVGALAVGVVATIKAVTQEKNENHRVLFHYSSDAAIAQIAATGMMFASDTYSSRFYKGAYATDVSPWDASFTQARLSVGFYNHPNADVSWFVAIIADDWVDAGAPYDPAVSHWVRPAISAGEAIPVHVVAVGKNPMP